MSLGRKHRRPPEPLLPKTVEEAVDFLIQRLPAADRLAILRTPREDLGAEFRVWGMGIRNGLGLWGKNEALRQSLPEEHRWPDAASDYIMELVRDRLRADADAQGTEGRKD